MNDARTPAQVAAMIRSRGFDPSMEGLGYSVGVAVFGNIQPCSVPVLVWSGLA